MKVKERIQKMGGSDAGKALVRAGYVIRGSLYMIMGSLALTLGYGGVAPAPGQTEAMILVGSAGLAGKILTFAVIIGLFGYAMWGIVRMTGKENWFIKMGYLCSSLGYTALIWPATVIFLGGIPAAKNGGNFLVQGVVTPAGRFLAIAAGGAAVISGIGQLFAADRKKSAEELRLNKNVPAHVEGALVNTARTGIAARAILIILMGIFFVLAGVKADPNTPAGIDQVLTAVLSWQYGKQLVGGIGVGLGGLGIYSLAQAKWFVWPKKYEKKIDN